MPDVLTDPLANLLSFFVKIGWVIGLSAVALWVMGWIRGRVRGAVRRRAVDNNLVIIVDNLVRIAVYLLIGLLLIGALSGDTGSTVTAVGLIVAAISLSLQDILRNFVSGIYLLIERPFAVGDTIRVADQDGVVQQVDIRTTRMQNTRREEIFVPNFRVFSDIVKRLPEVRAHRYQVQSPYPVHQSFDAIWNSALSVQEKPEPEPVVKIMGADTETIDFEVILWNTTVAVRSDAFIAAVKANLEKAIVKTLTE
jgi:small conductance mechanosensitive channel